MGSEGFLGLGLNEEDEKLLKQLLECDCGIKTILAFVSSRLFRPLTSWEVKILRNQVFPGLIDFMKLSILRFQETFRRTR